MRDQNQNQNQKKSGNEDRPANPKQGGGNGNKRFRHNKPPRNFWKSLLTNKGFDLLVLVIGITIAFAINNWMTAKDELAEENFYINNLAVDVDKDIARLTASLAGLKEDYEVLIPYVEKFGKEAVVGDSLASVVVAILSIDTFEGDNHTYLSMISTTKLPVITDPEVRIKLAEYYHFYKTIERFEDVYSNSLLDMNNYFSPSINYTLRSVINRSVLSSVQTKNNLLLATSHLEDGIERYQEALVLAQDLRKSLVPID
jgi:hypothetical protein